MRMTTPLTAADVVAARPLVLCVDDQPLVLKLLKRDLEAMGCRVHGVTSAQAALEVLATQRPALVLLDACMPGVSGYELCVQLQQSFGHLPVVFVTGLSDEANRKRAFVAGAVDYIVKPVVGARLVSVVQKHLQTGTRWAALARGSSPQVGSQGSTNGAAAVLSAIRSSIGVDADHPYPASLAFGDLYAACEPLGLTPHAMAEHISEAAGLPFISEVNEGDLALGVLPTPFCQAKHVVPLRTAVGELAFVIGNPFDLELRDVLVQASGVGRATRFLVAEPQAIERIFETPAKSPTTVTDARPGMRLVRAALESTEAPEQIGELTSLASRAPVVKLVNELLLAAIQQRASDIHIEPRQRCLGIRYRIDGRLEERPAVPKHLHAAVTSRIKIMAGMDIAQRRAPQDGRIRVTIAGGDVDLRVSTMPCRHGETVVMRILDKRALSLTFDALGFDSHSRGLLGAALQRPHGLVLVTGPTGSGKTTTLYTALQSLNTPERNVVTVEDPIEYELHRAMQVQIAPAAGLTFASALRSVLRQDPDIVMVGEIRDEETLDVALKASLTGHLVLSTLHTNDAVSTVARLHDMAAPYLVASALHLIVAQRLLRRLCARCKRTPIDGEPRFGSEGVFFEAVGCPSCRHTGYAGRLPVVEVMTMTEKLRDITRRPVDLDVLRGAALAGGMRPLQKAALDVAAAGETSLEEVARVVGL